MTYLVVILGAYCNVEKQCEEAEKHQTHRDMHCETSVEFLKSISSSSAQHLVTPTNLFALGVLAA